MKEDVGHFPVIVLPAVDDAQIDPPMDLCKLSYHRGGLDELRARTYNHHDLRFVHLRITVPSKSRQHSS
jgi:hypothetical protein